MGLKEAFVNIFGDARSIPQGAELTGDLEMRMQQHPKFKNVFYATRDVATSCTFWLRTFDDPKNKIGTLQSVESLEMLFTTLMDPQFQSSHAGREFQISILTGSRLYKTFDRWVMAAE